MIEIGYWSLMAIVAVLAGCAGWIGGTVAANRQYKVTLETELRYAREMTQEKRRQAEILKSMRKEDGIIPLWGVVVAFIAAVAWIYSR